MRFNFLSFIVAVGVCISSCNTINPKEKVPTYIHIDSFTFKTIDPVEEGTANQKITSAWVYFNNQTVGVFDIPATIPIITNEAGVVSVIPGVIRNGLNDYSTQYPFFKVDTLSIAPAPGQVVPYSATTSYVPDAMFQWKENFETGSGFENVNADIDTDTSIVNTFDKNMVFEGKSSGYIYVDAAHPTSENVSRDGFPIASGRSFLEINYKCNTSFQVGLVTTVGGVIRPRYEIGIKPRDTWNKLYIDLSQFTSEFKGSTYRVMIKTGLDAGLSTGYVLLDNLKVISF